MVIHSITWSSTQSHGHPLNHMVTHSITWSPTQSHGHSLNHMVTHSLTHTLSLDHISITRSPTHTLSCYSHLITHSLTHSPAHISTWVVIKIYVLMTLSLHHLLVTTMPEEGDCLYVCLSVCLFDMSIMYHLYPPAPPPPLPPPSPLLAASVLAAAGAIMIGESPLSLDCVDYQTSATLASWTLLYSASATHNHLLITSSEEMAVRGSERCSEKGVRGGGGGGGGGQ